MARQPAPRIDPRDPVLRPIKDFLDWLYVTVPGFDTAIDAAVAAAEAAETLAINAQATADAALSSVVALASAFATLEDDVADLATDVADVAADLTSIEVRTTESLSFFHLGNATSSSTTRRMFVDYSSDRWTSSLGWRSRRIIPRAGEIMSLTTQHPPNNGGSVIDITYTVWRSTDGGLNWSATSVAHVHSSLNSDHKRTAFALAVAEGDLLGIEMTYSGTIANVSGNFDSHIAVLEYRRTA